MKKTTQLRRMIESPDLEFLLEAHGGMSAKIVDEAVGEWIGLAAFGADASSALFETMEALLMDGDLSAYDTAAFNRVARAGEAAIELMPTEAPWWEIDDSEDLETARELFGGDG